MTERKIICLEFNELCPDLLVKWMGEGKLPNFARFYESSSVFTTSADVEDAAYLEPWIQWYSMHTGLSYDQHQVFHLSDGPSKDFTDIWGAVADAGHTVGSFLSMNNKHFNGNGNFFVPDPWTHSEPCSPPELHRFYDFVSKQVQEYTNVDGKSATREAVDFVAFMAGHGLRPGTVASILKQLASEKLSSKNLSWKRVAHLDRMEFDVFRHYFKKCRPTFSSFFANSTAHLQHAYWRYMEPEKFQLKPNSKEYETYRDAVLFGYQSMDNILAGFFDLERRYGATLILTSALSQKAYTKNDAKGGQIFHRPRDIEAFLEDINIKPSRIDPVMTHQYFLRFDRKEDEIQARQRLEAFELGGEDVFGFADHDDDGIYFGCQIFNPVSESTVVLDRQRNFPQKFCDIFYQIDGTKSGCHHPDGVFWIKDGRSMSGPEKVSILDVFPTILGMLDVPIPSDEYRSGRSLL